jgi:choline dehydrogenase-like flavoprotein
MLGKSHGDTIKVERSVDALGAEMPFDVMARHSVDFWLTSEDLPDPNNRVSYQRDGSVLLDLTEGNMEGHHRLQGKLKGMLNALDMHQHFLPRSLYLGKNIPIGGTAHQAGTIRFGTDPKALRSISTARRTSSTTCIVDAGFFVSIGAVNPTLTIIANALRVADHLLERLR